MSAPRIRESDLQAIVTQLNKTTNSPLETYTKTKTEGYKASIGNYHIDYAYGGVALYQISSIGGGCIDVFNCGHTTKRDLYNRIRAYKSGYNIGAM